MWMATFDQLNFKLVAIKHVRRSLSFHMTFKRCTPVIHCQIFASLLWLRTSNQEFGMTVSTCHSACGHTFHSGKSLACRCCFCCCFWNHLLCSCLHRNDADGFTGETTKHSHSIIVADSKLQQHVRKHITQYDQIFLEGHLNYKSVQLENGMKRICGNIIPVHIEKI